MEGKYIKPNGEKVEVEEFDQINKMVLVKFVRGKQQWYHEHEYNFWVKEGEDAEAIPEEVVEKVEKPKTVKKKAAPKKKAK